MVKRKQLRYFCDWFSYSCLSVREANGVRQRVKPEEIAVCH